ncbi:MAG: hypothetical protein MAG451_02672 [Anaerolineales bacterium]|nr:hypothetical protein [Anaerolineales bacterium]
MQGIIARHGPEGFTQREEIREIMEPLLRSEELGGIIRFSGLTVEDGRKLLELLPPANRECYHNAAPSFSEFVLEVGERFPDALFFGHQVIPEREDECISIEGVLLPMTSPSSDRVLGVMKQFAQSEPDELDPWEHEDKSYWRLWWD